jgi:hypothetical protein
MLEPALSIWESEKGFYRPEIARGLFLKSQILGKQGKNDESTTLRARATAQRKQVPYAHEKDDEALTEADFDEIVMYWSR